MLNKSGIDLSSVPHQVIRYAIGLWRRRWIVAIVAWLTAIIGWFGIWLLPDVYESRAQVFVQTETILDPVMNGVTARPNYERRVEVMRNQLLTRPNIEEVIFRAGLDKEIKAKTPLAKQAELQRLTEWVANKIKIESPQDLYFVIKFHFGDPIISRNVVDEFVNLLIEQDLGASLTESQEARRRLDAQIVSYGDRLTAKEREIAEFRRDNADELSLLQGEALRRDRVEADLSRLADELSQAKRRVTTLQTILSQTPRTSSSNQRDKLLVELAALRSQYRDDHPDIRAVQARINELSAEGGAMLPRNPEFRRVSNDLRAARDAVASLQQRERDLRAERETLSFTIGQAPQVQADLQRIQRDYEQTRRSYEELVQRRERLSLTESLGAGGKGVEYKVYERPVAAIKPIAPPRFILIIGVLFIALGAGASASAAVTFFEKTFTQSSELATKFGLPILGAISEVPSKSVIDRRRSDYIKLSGALALLIALAGVYTYWEVFRLPSGAAFAAEAHLEGRTNNQSNRSGMDTVTGTINRSNIRFSQEAAATSSSNGISADDVPLARSNVNEGSLKIDENKPDQVDSRELREKDERVAR
ncbi:MAG: XrtA system polysaccharide chain length determinant [Pseudomonadota bacterium]